MSTIFQLKKKNKKNWLFILLGVLLVGRGKKDVLINQRCSLKLVYPW